VAGGISIALSPTYSKMSACLSFVAIDRHIGVTL
jgi:hypothetical protein